MAYICFDCIGDEFLKRETAVYAVTVCNFCGVEDSSCLSADRLAELLMPLLGLYTPVEEFMAMEEMKDLAGNGDMIWEKLQEDWNLFPELGYAALETLFNEMLFSSDEPTLLLSSYVENEREYYGLQYEITDELIEEWKNFCKEIVQENRYFPQKMIHSETLSGSIELLENTLPTGKNFYRARISETKEGYPIEKLGMAPAEKCKSGRANPIGIPYLYLASTMATAIAEVRPVVLDTVSIGEFVLVEPLNIIDLARTIEISPFRLGENIQDYLLYLGFLEILGQELSKPIHPNKTELEYIPLQYLCEFIKKRGYDGVTYKSSVGEGYNLAVFRETKFHGIAVSNVEITSVEYLHK